MCSCFNRNGVRLMRVLIVSMLSLMTAGCGVFNPAFLNLIDISGTGQFQSINNAPGHVVLAVINNTTIEERLLDFLEGKLTLTNAEKLALKPRIRMRLRITFTDGNFQTIEFITGSPDLVDPDFDAQAFPDLNQNDLNNAVVSCDVANIIQEPNSIIEVFVPVELTAFELVETANQVGGVTTEFQPRGRIVPQFQNLLVDDLGPDDNVVLQRNIGIRDVLNPAPTVFCGSVVTIVITGVLSVPFLDGVSDSPSYDLADEDTVASIGGRYEFRLTMR